jgi:uncharacterized membrane protein YphA (DoxX/SURF4 family)
MALAFLVGRLLFGGFFLFNGLNHFMSVPMMAQFAAAKGVPYPELGIIFTGCLLVFGGLSIMLGWRPDLGVAALVFFLVIVTPAMHNFWDESGAERLSDTGHFLKNVALAGGALMLVAVPRPWIYSIERAGRLRVSTVV